MVVLAGLVGAGGLAAGVTRGLTRMEMGFSMRAVLAIMALALLFDRLLRTALQRGRMAVKANEKDIFRYLFKCLWKRSPHCGRWRPPVAASAHRRTARPVHA